MCRDHWLCRRDCQEASSFVTCAIWTVFDISKRCVVSQKGREGHPTCCSSSPLPVWFEPLSKPAPSHVHTQKKIWKLPALMWRFTNSDIVNSGLESKRTSFYLALSQRNRTAAISSFLTYLMEDLSNLWTETIARWQRRGYILLGAFLRKTEGICSILSPSLRPTTFLTASLSFWVLQFIGQFKRHKWWYGSSIPGTWYWSGSCVYWKKIWQIGVQNGFLTGNNVSYRGIQATLNEGSV